MGHAPGVLPLVTSLTTAFVVLVVVGACGAAGLVGYYCGARR